MKGVPFESAFHNFDPSNKIMSPLCLEFPFSAQWAFITTGKPAGVDKKTM